MKTTLTHVLGAALLLSCLCIGRPAHAQGGSLTPSAAPGATMRSLQEIWDKLEDLDSRLTTLEGTSESDESNTNLLIESLGSALNMSKQYVWSTTTVDSSGTVGKYTSLAFDGSGHPAISYHDASNTSLRYAAKDGAAWSQETVDNSGNTGAFTSLAFLEDGRPLIAYYDSTDEALKVACNYGTWLYNTVHHESGKQIGWYISLKVGPDGRPAISYRNQTDFELVFAQTSIPPTGVTGEFGSEDWNIGSVATTDSPGHYTSLAFNPSGYPSIAHGSSGTYYLMMTSKGSSSWSTGSVDTGGPRGNYTSLAYNDAGTAGISYYDSDTKNLYYAENPGTGWTATVVDSTGDVGQYSSLGFTRGGQPGIAYYDATNGDLKYAERQFDGTWKLWVVDSTGNVGSHCSLAINKHGRPAISYHDATNGDLKYTEASSSLLVAGAGIGGVSGGGN